MTEAQKKIEKAILGNVSLQNGIHAKTPQFDQALDEYFGSIELDGEGGQWRVCRVSRERFYVRPQDVEFYKKMSVPLPTLSPAERMRLLLAFENTFNLFTIPSAFSGKPMIAAYPPGTPYRVYERKVWFSDQWDPLAYGKEYDAKKGFFEQFALLKKEVPRPNVFSDAKNVNSEYTNLCERVRNNYLAFFSFDSENITYVDGAFTSRNCIDGFSYYDCEGCYKGREITNCYNCSFVEHSNDCRDSKFLFDCKNCSDCFMSSNLRNKKYYFGGEQLSKEEYAKKVNAINLGNYDMEQKYQAMFEDLKQKAIRKPAWSERSVNCLGQFVVSSKDCYLDMWVENCQNVHYSIGTYNVRDAYDIAGGGVGKGSELMYESTMAFGANYQLKFCLFVKDSRNIEYSDLCRNSSDCFGCIGLSNKRFCIFNKQYSEDEYWRVVDEIKTAMMKDKTYGEFFPPRLSPHPYNLSLNLSYPGFDNLADAQKYGYRVEDIPRQLPEAKTKVVKSDDLPLDIADVADAIVEDIIEDTESKKYFRIIPSELAFYREHTIPLPRKHPLVRLASWRKDIDLRLTFHDRSCPKCAEPFKTPYKPNQFQGKVYCETCYQKEVI